MPRDCWLVVVLGRLNAQRFSFCCSMRDVRARKHFVNNWSYNGEFGELLGDPDKTRRLELAHYTFEYLVGVLR
jgi:hypothetical protein